MEKLVFSVCFLAICFLISDSSCLENRPSQKFSLFKSRQASNNFKRRSFLADKLDVRGKDKGKDPPPPPPASDVWKVLGISREDFIEENKDKLTSEVRTDIKNQMVESINEMKTGIEMWARALSCASLSGSGPLDKRTLDDTAAQAEQNITEVEEQEENELQALLSTFGVNESNIETAVQNLPKPKYIGECQKSPLIMRTGDIQVDKELTLVICGRLLFMTTAKRMDELDGDTMDSFIDMFEEYLKGTLTFIRMYFLSTEVPDDQSGDEIARMFKENKLRELKRFLQDAMADLTFRK